jgi:hypothetical protein
VSAGGLRWIQPNEEVVAHLRRDSEKGDGSTADWLVSIKKINAAVAEWEVITRFGPTNAARGASKVLSGFATERNARAEAHEHASRKLGDRRYQTVQSSGSSGISESPTAMKLYIGAEIRLSDWNDMMLKIARLGLRGISDRLWHASMDGTDTISFTQLGDRIWVSGYIAVTDTESRPLFAAAAIVTKGRITNATGDAIDLEEWILEVRSKLSHDAADLAADFGLLPKRLNYAKLASSIDTGAWADLI